MSASHQLREMLNSQELGFLMEAHDGLSARIAEAEGFEAIWASGYSMSTALGVRDSDEASWSQLLTVVEWMVDAVSIPILVDGDTGYGNFNTARRFVRKAERLGAAGVCFEDKVFPKMNSFVGDGHRLAPVEEFAGKIRACKDALGSSDFCLIARTESLIAGRSVGEALERAEVYRQAGADGIFIHSRKPAADEIEAFAAEWGSRLPIVISPTTYAGTPTSVFRERGISAVIWANQSMRAAIVAMRRACREIRQAESATAADVELAPLNEVFKLMHYEELELDERRYTGGSIT
jgi:phosphoenolpyruvate phosphomutase